MRCLTYAIWWIGASMQAYILLNWSIVRDDTSSAQESLFFNLWRIHVHLVQKGGPIDGAAAYHKISLALSVFEANVALMDMMPLAVPDASLDTPLDNYGDTSEHIDLLVLKD